MSTARLSRTPTALNCAGGFNRFEDDHLSKCFVYCPCQSCRPPEFDFENCQLKDWTGTWENHTIAYKSGAAVTEKKKEMRAAIKGFSEEVEQGTFLVVGLSAKEAADDDYVKKNSMLRFSVVRAVDVPFFTEQRITANVEGVIQKGNWVCEVQWLKRVSALGFVPEDTDSEQTFDVISMESCMLIDDLYLEDPDGAFHTTPVDYARIKSRNLARFSSYHKFNTNFLLNLDGFLLTYRRFLSSAITPGSFCTTPIDPAPMKSRIAPATDHNE